jgi:tRNA (guanosine-2'-O-)-methyltransferase
VQSVLIAEPPGARLSDDPLGALDAGADPSRQARPPSRRVSKATRVAAGSAQWLDVSLKRGPLEETVGELKESGWEVLATAVDEQATDVREVDWPGRRGAPPGRGGKGCVGMGNEESGVSAELLSLCDGSFFLPMRGFAESYNLSVAASLTCAYMSSAGVLAPSAGKEEGGDWERAGRDEQRERETELRWLMTSLPKANMAEQILKRAGIEIVM